MARLVSIASMLFASLCFSSLALAQETYKVAWTIYAGSMPLGYAQDHGILQKWGNKYGFKLEAVQMNDYIEAQTQFSMGQFAATIAMSLDALTIPAASGTDTTVVMPLSSSMGSDGIVLRGKDKTLADLKGQTINLVELSGSHYMLVRALDQLGLKESDVKLVNTSDSDMAAVFFDPATMAAATWKPQLSEILAQSDDLSLVFDSSKIPGELVDVMAVNSELLRREPNLGKALAGAWFETLAMLQPDHPQHADLMDYMAQALSATPEGLADQLSTIDFFTPAQGLDYVNSTAFKTKMTEMTRFAFQQGLFEGAKDADYVGIEAGDGQILGSADNVKLRFASTWLNEVQQ